MRDPDHMPPPASAVEAEWERKAKRLLRAEMALRGLTYDGLREKLEGIGVRQSTAVIARKISRGQFKANFFLQCLTAMGVKELLLTKESVSNGAARSE